MKAFGLASCDLPAYSLESEPGNVVYFNHRTWHASFGGATGRRMLSLTYKVKPRTKLIIKSSGITSVSAARKRPKRGVPGISRDRTDVLPT